MDEKRLRDALYEIAVDAVPFDKDPWTAFHVEAEAEFAGTRTKQKQSWMKTAWDIDGLRLGKSMAVIAITFVLMVVMIASLPQGKAWAQQIADFFTRAEAQFFPLSPEQIEGANRALYDEDQGDTRSTAAPPESLSSFAESCADDELGEGLRCQVELAEEAVGFTILLPPAEESGLFFSSLTVDATANSVEVSYAYQYDPGREQAVWISQGVGDFPVGSEWDKVPAQFIESVLVKGEQAEFVQGAFVVSPGAEKATWLEDGPMARLRWKDGERWFEIFKAGSHEKVTNMDREGMIQLAESFSVLEDSK